MPVVESLDIIAVGEKGHYQFKVNPAQRGALAAELAAFANSGGGCILVGVAEDGSAIGLNQAEAERLIGLITHTAAQFVRPPLHILSNTLRVDDRLVLAFSVPHVVNQPYVDDQGIIWIRNGAGRRQATGREEGQRMPQRPAQFYADEALVTGATVADLDEKLFGEFYRQRYGESVAQSGLPLPHLLEMLHLAHEGVLNLTGLLLFGRDPQRWRPAFMVKAMVYPGMDIGIPGYIDSQDITGTLLYQYRRAFAFIIGHLQRIDGLRGANGEGLLEIPALVFEELLVNALVHRDYCIGAPVRIFIFYDRIEIANPGHLLDNLSVAQIRRGLSNMRNPTLMSFASHWLPYQQIGDGIVRALKAYPKIEFYNEPQTHQFRAVVWREIPRFLSYR